jgi:hypothetical protein
MIMVGNVKVEYSIFNIHGIATMHRQESGILYQIIKKT